MDKVADAILTLQGGMVGNSEVDHSKLVEKTIFALIGLGEFQARCGIGAYGKELNACLRRMAAYGKEEILESGARCIISNRLSYGISTLKVGTFCRGKDDSKTSTLSDCIPSTVGEMENHYRDNAEVDPVGRYPWSLEFAKRIIRNQNLVWSVIFGSEHYPERAEALECEVLRHEESPEFFSIPFLASIWERMTIDYVQKVTDGVRCLTQLGSKSDGLEESKRLARHSQGRHFAHTFCMESSTGYWGIYVLPKIDLGTGRAEYRGRSRRYSHHSGSRRERTPRPLWM